MKGRDASKMEHRSDGERLGLAVLHLRQVRGEEQQALARRAGVTPAWLSKLERGQIANPGYLTADAVAQALGFRDGNDLLRWQYGHDRFAKDRPRTRGRGRPRDDPATPPASVAPPPRPRTGRRPRTGARAGPPPSGKDPPRVPDTLLAVVGVLQACHILEALGLLGALGGLRAFNRVDVHDVLQVLDVLVRTCANRA